MRSARFGDHLVSFDHATGVGREEGGGAEPLVATGLADLARAPVLRPPRGPAVVEPFTGAAEPGDDLLVAAALAPAPEATRAWEQWCARTDLDAVDDRVRSALVSIRARLDDDLGPGEALRGDLDRYQARVWLRSQLLLHAADRLARGLAVAGIRPVGLKGVAVLHHGGLRVEERPMGDVDLLVPTARLADAVTAAAAVGFAAGGLVPEAADAWARDLHAVGLGDGSGTDVDLHWHLLAADAGQDLDAEVHRRAVEVAARPWTVTSREDALLHVVVHGVGWTRRPGPRWILDSAALLGAPGDLRWDVVLAEAEQRRIGPVLATGLDRLARSWVEVPQAVREQARRLGTPVQRLALSPRSSAAAKLAAVAADRHRSHRVDVPPTLPEGVTHAATGPLPAAWLTDGWGAPHAWGTWSRSPTPTIRFDAERAPARVQLDVVPLVGPRHRSVLVVALDRGRPVGARRLRSDDAPATWDIRLAPRRRRPTSTVRLTLLVLVPCSPTRAGREGPVDHRPLGIRVLGLRWTP
jgi:hypothetical protein